MPPHFFHSNVASSPNHVPQLPQKVRIYHDSNLQWSSPAEIRKNISSLNIKDAQNVQISLCKTSKLEDMVRAVEHDDNRNTIVIISTMTNNAKNHESFSKCRSLLKKAFDILQRQTCMKNVIFLESPPSHKFEIFFYNKMAHALCKDTGATFALNLVVYPHIKSDGLHIKAPFKHLMTKSVAAAIVKKVPYFLFGLTIPRRYPCQHLF